VSRRRGKVGRHGEEVAWRADGVARRTSVGFKLTYESYITSVGFKINPRKLF
jgi:hypothetical protein